MMADSAVCGRALSDDDHTPSLGREQGQQLTDSLLVRRDDGCRGQSAGLSAQPASGPTAQNR
jgi:hypothetical protein